MKTILFGRSTGGGEVCPCVFLEKTHSHRVIRMRCFNLGCKAGRAMMNPVFHDRCAPRPLKIPRIAADTLKRRRTAVIVGESIGGVLRSRGDAKVGTAIVEAIVVLVIHNQACWRAKDQMMQSYYPFATVIPHICEGIPDAALPTCIPAEGIQQVGVLIINPKHHSIGEFATNHEPAAASTNPQPIQT